MLYSFITLCYTKTKETTIDKKQLKAMLADRKKDLEEARTHYKKNDMQNTGPYSDVEFDKEIEQLEVEVKELESKLKEKE